jgi:hypothetical protein
MGIEDSVQTVNTGVGGQSVLRMWDEALTRGVSREVWAIFRCSRAYPMGSKPDRLSIIWCTQSVGVHLRFGTTI